MITKYRVNKAGVTALRVSGSDDFQNACDGKFHFCMQWRMVYLELVLHFWHYTIVFMSPEHVVAPP